MRRVGRFRLSVPSFSIACALAIAVGPPALIAEEARVQTAARPLDRVLQLHPRIVNGDSTAGQWPEVGLLLPVDEGGSYCSGTLIGCNTFLTAASCFPPNPDPADYYVFLQHAGYFTLDDITVNPSWTGSVNGPGDLAVAHFEFGAFGIHPAKINTLGRPAAGSEGSIVGFGTPGGGGPTGGGLLRSGKVLTAACSPFASDATHLCWNLQTPLGPAGDDSGICGGDTGGPLLFNSVNGLVVGGVHSKISNATCQPDVQAADPDVYVERQWIQSVAGSDLANTSCGAVGQVSDTGSLVFANDSHLDPGETTELWMVDIPSGIQNLRFTLTIEQVTGANFQLYARRGAPPSLDPLIVDCFGIVTGNSPEYCAETNPEAGTWYILVKREAGSGDYQLVTTALPAPATPPSTPDTTPCFRSISVACLLGDRFEVKVRMYNFQNPPQLFVGRIQEYEGKSSETDQSVSFYSFQDGNVEVFVKMVDACSSPSFVSFWLFAAGATNAQTEITVRDTHTGLVRTINNASGHLFETVANTEAFETCQSGG